MGGVVVLSNAAIPPISLIDSFSSLVAVQIGLFLHIVVSEAVVDDMLWVRTSDADNCDSSMCMGDNVRP